MSGGLDCPAIMLQSSSLPPPSSADFPGGPPLPLLCQGQSRFRARCLGERSLHHTCEYLSRWMAGPGASAFQDSGCHYASQGLSTPRWPRERVEGYTMSRFFSSHDPRSSPREATTRPQRNWYVHIPSSLTHQNGDGHSTDVHQWMKDKQNVVLP